MGWRLPFAKQLTKHLAAGLKKMNVCPSCTCLTWNYHICSGGPSVLINMIHDSILILIFLSEIETGNSPKTNGEHEKNTNNWIFKMLLVKTWKQNCQWSEQTQTQFDMTSRLFQIGNSKINRSDDLFPIL